MAFRVAELEMGTGQGKASVTQEWCCRNRSERTKATKEGRVRSKTGSTLLQTAALSALSCCLLASIARTGYAVVKRYRYYDLAFTLSTRQRTQHAKGSQLWEWKERNKP